MTIMSSLRPSPTVPSDDIRHAYLHYVLEPIAIKYSADSRPSGALQLRAECAAGGRSVHASQFVELATECFIKAVESRIAHKPALVDQALREGYVLTPAFAEQLVAYENQEATMRVYFPDLVDKIDVKREQKRLAGVQFVTDGRCGRCISRSAPVAPAGADRAPPRLWDDPKALFPARLSDARCRRKHFPPGRSGNRPESDARKGVYGLARVALLEKRPGTASVFWHKVLALDPDPGPKAWSLLYLGRLAIICRAAVSRRRNSIRRFNCRGCGRRCARRRSKVSIEITNQK